MTKKYILSTNVLQKNDIQNSKKEKAWFALQNRAHFLILRRQGFVSKQTASSYTLKSVYDIW